MAAARLVPCCDEALRQKGVHDPILIMLDKVRSMAHQFDVLHFHIDQIHFPLFRDLADRRLTTLHGRQDLPDLRYLYAGFPEMPLVSISNAQREAIPDAALHGPADLPLAC